MADFVGQIVWSPCCWYQSERAALTDPVETS